MACGGLKNPINGAAPKFDANGNLKAAVDGSIVDVGSIADPVPTKPAAWTPTSHHNGSIDDGGLTAFVSTSTGRSYIRMTNIGPNDAFIRPGASPSTNDTPLLVGASIEFHGGYDGEWYGITGSSGQTATIAIIEFKI